VSGEGVCLETNTVMVGRVHVLGEAMGDDGRLVLTIGIPDWENPLEVLGRVRWYDLAPESSDFRFRAGVLFTDMDRETRQKWRRFLSTIRKRRFFGSSV
jgi:hypothetical protein